MKRIVVIGNINADMVYRVDHAVGPGVETGGASLGTRLGGSGANAGSALAAAGDHVQMFGFIGDDAAGDTIAALLPHHPWDTIGVARRPGATRSCLILIDPAGERTIIGVGPRGEPPDWPAMPLAGADCVYYASAWPLQPAVVARLRASGAPVVCQLRSAERLGFATVAVTSDSHLTRGDAADPWAAIRVRGIAADWLVVTRGAGGAMATDGAVLLQIPAAPARVVDTTGAGDAFAAGLVHAIARRQPMARALALATAWAAQAVAHLGSTFPPDAVQDDDVQALTGQVTQRPYP